MTEQKCHLSLVEVPAYDPFMEIDIKLTHDADNLPKNLNQYQLSAMLRELGDIIEKFRVDMMAVQAKYEKMAR